MSDILDDRRRALEEQFFKSQNEALVKKMRDAAQRKATASSVQQLTGIKNQHVLDMLSAMNIGTAAATVMSIFPLVQVAWADEAIDEKERKVIIDQAKSVGISADSEAAHYLEHWLTEKPTHGTHELWKEYVTELVKTMKPNEKEMLKNEVLGRARLVAEASGGFLGFGFNISKAEQHALEQLAVAFT